ncbi:MAG: DUF4293 domain-containing protein [Prevotella sp.]|nr:DUF4293 domain-containing protein [Prevotella sp.]
MIQRKQTVFILLAVALTIVCLSLPLCRFTAIDDIGNETVMYNLWLTNAEGAHDLSVWALFAILLVTCPIGLFTIFAFHNRIAQSRLCAFNILLIIGWYAVFVILMLAFSHSLGDWHIAAACVFPLVSAILYFIARKAILADEALVRAADRIR